MSSPVPDPLSLATSPIIAVNAAASIVNNVMSIGDRFSIAQAQYNRFLLTELFELRTTLPDDERGGYMVEFRLRELHAQRFETRLEYTRHCRVAGVRCVRHRLDLRLTGLIAPYVAVYKDRNSPTSWDEIVTPVVDADGKPVHGFLHVSLGIGDNPGLQTFPFSKFNDDTEFTWKVSIRRSGSLEFTWRATSSGFTPGGMPIAFSKAKSGRFLLSDNAVLTPVGEDSWKYFAICPVVVPAPSPPPERPSRGDASGGGERVGAVDGDVRAQAPDQVFAQSARGTRGRKTTFKKGKQAAAPRGDTAEGEPEVRQPKATGATGLFRRMTGRSKR